MVPKPKPVPGTGAGHLRFSSACFISGRMPRIPRDIKPGRPHYLVVRSSRNQDIFVDDNDRREYRKLIRRAEKQTGCRVTDHALMSNHALFIIWPKTNTVADFLRIIQLGYAKHFCRKYDTSGHIWRGHSSCTLIPSDTKLAAYAAHIRNYPGESKVVQVIPKQTSTHPTTPSPSARKLIKDIANLLPKSPAEIDIYIGSRYNGTLTKLRIPNPHRRRNRPP